MSVRRLLDLWAPPTGHRLASALATTYECQADFVEEDLLPVALGLRTPSARGRDFRLELERALQDVEVTLYLHPDRYQPGLRRSPRLDLVPLPEGRAPKLHAKVALLRFVPEGSAALELQRVRLVVGSANLTNPGYRSNLEVAVTLEDGPEVSPAEATAVRDATRWLRDALVVLTEQARRQLRDLEAVFAARPIVEDRADLRFVGLPGQGGLVEVLRATPVGKVHTLTVVSPFWPAGEEPDDVVAGLERASGGLPDKVRLVAAAGVDAEGMVRPAMPAAFLRALLRRGATVEIAAADPGHGCVATGQEEDEFSSLAPGGARGFAHRELHAKLLLLQGQEGTLLAAGSFNLTRRGLGLHRGGNTEAGLVWRLPARPLGQIAPLFAYATAWTPVARAPEELVVPPPVRQGPEGGGWPPFIYALRATRTHLEVEGDGALWPAQVTLRMRDIRARLVAEERWFDPWQVASPGKAGPFTAALELRASWMAAEGRQEMERNPPLADLEVELSWPGGETTLPVIFVDKHLFPVVERRQREDERALIDWFLGLRPPEESDGDGYGHGIDPVEDVATEEVWRTSDILSYLVRDFVHALPGVRAGLCDSALTETGLRATLLGPRSPVALAREAVEAWCSPRRNGPRKTEVATLFQLVELSRAVADAPLPDLPEGATPRVRAEALAEIRAQLNRVLERLPEGRRPPVLSEYLASFAGGPDATT